MAIGRPGADRQASSLALSILSRQSSPFTIFDIPTAVVDLLLDQLQDSELDKIKVLAAQPSHAYQVKHTTTISERALFIAQHSLDPKILRNLAKKSSIRFKRALASNPNLPADILQPLITWAFQHKDLITVERLSRAAPLLGFLSSALMEVAGFDSTQSDLAQRINNECTQEVAELALKLKDPNILAELAVAAYEGRAGRVTLTQVLETISGIRKFDDAPLRSALERLLLESKEITAELLQLTSTWAGKIDLSFADWELDYSPPLPPAPKVSQSTKSKILELACAPDFLPAGYQGTSKNKPILSINTNWTPLAVLALRLSAAPNLTAKLFSAILKITHVRGASNLLKNKALKLTSSQIDELLELVGREIIFIPADQFSYMEILTEISNTLLANYKLTGKQLLVAHLIGGDDSINWMVGGTLPDWSHSKNGLTLDFIKALVNLPERLPYYSVALGQGEPSRDKVVSWFVGQLSFAADGGCLTYDQSTLTYSYQDLPLSAEVKKLLLAVTPVTSLAQMIKQSHTSHSPDLLGVGSAVSTRLDSHLEKWQLLLSLLPTWNSYLPELLDTVDSLVVESKPATKPPSAPGKRPQKLAKSK